jgi:hypothetical protein
MKSYKINQTIEKNLYPIEAKLDEIKESNKENLELIFKIYAPVFLSSILTVAFGNSVITNNIGDNINELSSFDKLISTWCGKVICIIVLFVVFSAVISIVCYIINKANSKRDNKRNDEERSKLAKIFYKIIIPEIITGASLFERAYEIESINSGHEINSFSADAENIELKDTRNISDKATLYYYEALYHFKLVANLFATHEIIEYRDSNRENLNLLYNIIGEDALKKTIGICCHCVEELVKRVDDTEIDNILKQFKDYTRNLNKE